MRGVECGRHLFFAGADPFEIAKTEELAQIEKRRLAADDLGLILNAVGLHMNGPLSEEARPFLKMLAMSRKTQLAAPESTANQMVCTLMMQQKRTDIHGNDLLS
ncbi:hypothetical protein [Methylorubrum salsuginis]|uniref:hypothetical protein n=1 Tax=Methylorubrum salsuginis TaxID=414703 RepID=UPI00104203EA|nr:hypothetical protein [Methylorubrum salsuginis]